MIPKHRKDLLEGNLSSDSSFRHRIRRGYTLLEIMLAMTIAAIMMMVAVPMVANYRTQRVLREPAEKLERLVLRARELALRDRRAYVIELYSDYFTLHPAELKLGETAVLALDRLAPRQRLLMKTWGETEWHEARGYRWEFVAGRLCEPLRLRFQRGSTFIEQSFSPLTGLILSETISIP